MEKQRQVWLPLLYGASAWTTCVLVDTTPGSIPHRVMKVLPVLLLGVSRWRERGDHLGNFIGFGLVASLLGDSVIDSNFVAGLASFLLGHLFYILALGRPTRSARGLLAMLPALIIGGAMLWVLVGLGHTPEPLRIPVTVYSAVLSLMFGRAMARAFVEVKDRASIIFMLGALFFVISDALIGIRRWVVSIPHGSVWIMSTYYLAQWLIYTGSSPRLRKQ